MGKIISTFFTNKNGKFILEKAYPGEYIISLFERTGIQYRIFIQDGLNGILSLGKLKPISKYE